VSADSPQPGYYPNDPEKGFLPKKTLPMTPSFSMKDTDSRLLDLDGDGIVDLLTIRNNTPIGFFNDRGQSWSTPYVYSSEKMPFLNLGDPRLRFADMTGNGKPDIVSVYSGRIVYHPFDPVSGWGEEQVMSKSPGVDVRSESERIFLIDVTGDGLSDLVQVGNETVTIWLNRGGMEFSEPMVISRTPPLSGNRVLIADMNGTGTAGLLWSRVSPASTPPYCCYLDFWGGSKPYLMNRITNNRGLETRIKYETSVQQRIKDWEQNSDWSGYLPFPVQVVTEVVNEDQVAETIQKTSYRYHDGNYDWRSRRYLGFGRVESFEYGDSTEDGTYKVMHFHNQADDDEELRQAARGEPYNTEIRSLSNHDILFEAETAHYDTISFPGKNGKKEAVITLEKAREVQRYHEGSVYQSDKTEKAYNSVGLLTSDKRTGKWFDKDDIEHEDILITEREYAVDSQVQMTGLPSVKRKIDKDGKLLRLERVYYDGPAFRGLPLGTVLEGLRTRIEEAVLADRHITEAYSGEEPDLLRELYTVEVHPTYGRLFFRQKERLKRGDQGVVVESLNPTGASTKIEYDAQRLYPTRITSDDTWVQEVLYDPAAEQITWNKDVNGNITRTIYDPLGNITAVYQSGAVSGKPTETYEYHFETVPNLIVKKIRLKPGEDQPSWWQYEYKDGHQREFQKKTLAENGKWAVGSQERFNSKGRKVKEFDAYFSNTPDFEPVPPAGTALSAMKYDAPGRLIEQVHYNGAVSLIGYQGALTNYYSPLIREAYELDPNTTPTRQARRDAWNRAVEVTENSEIESVTYLQEFDPFDRIVDVYNPTGTRTLHYIYDMAGKSIRIESIDGGNETIIRDANFKEVLTTDSDDRTVYREYDQFARIIALRRGGPTGELRETHRYDGGESDNTIGRLKRVDAHWGSAEYSYNHAGKVTAVTRSFIDHPHSYTVEYGYNSQSNPVFVKYPDSTQLNYIYNSAGLLESIPGIIESADYNATGKRTRIRYTNGVETTIGYSPGDYQVSEIKTLHLASGDKYQHLVYHFDDVGQVLAIDDNATVTGKVRNNQTFEYDLRHQLVRATGKGAGGPYDYFYQYDLLGNMTRNDEAVGDDIVYGLQEGELDHPNRMVRRKTAAAREFQYDQSGNLIETPNIQSIDYCHKHKPTVILSKDGTKVEYIYDHDGRCTITKITKDGSVSIEYNVENLLYIREDRTTKVVFDLNKKLAIIPSEGDSILFHIDRQGNNNILSNLNTGAYVGQNEYTPYGRLSVSMLIRPNFSFQQSRLNADVKMVLLGSRYYLPEYGRFLVTDTYLLHTPGKLKMFLISFNLYSYSNNNPINFVDPSGNFVFLLAGVLACLTYVLIAVVVGAVVVGAVAGIIGAAVNGAETWDEWLLSIVAGIVGAILVTLVGFWIGGIVGAIIALSIFMIASWIGTPIARALDDSDSEAAWFFSFLIKWVQSPVLTTIGLFVVMGYAFAGHDVDLERGALFVNVGGSGTGALTLGAIIYTQGGNFDASGDVDDDLAKHEAYHTRQVAAFGEMGFYLTYITLGIIWGAAEADEPFGTDNRGCGNPFEKTARTFNHNPPVPTSTGQC
jgi:RHS repeat-associated protein